MMRENSHEPEPRNLKLIFTILRKLELNSEIIALFEIMESKDRAPEHFTGALEAFAHSTRLSEVTSYLNSFVIKNDSYALHFCRDRFSLPNIYSWIDLFLLSKDRHLKQCFFYIS
eukprot:UN05518